MSDIPFTHNDIFQPSPLPTEIAPSPVIISPRNPENKQRQERVGGTGLCTAQRFVSVVGVKQNVGRGVMDGHDG